MNYQISDGQDDAMTPEQRQEIKNRVAETYPQSLAARAVAEYDNRATEIEQKEAAKADEQRRLREDFATRQEASAKMTLNETLAGILKVGKDDPAVANLDWKVDRESLERLQFRTPPGRMGIESGDYRDASLYAEVIEGLWIEAAPWGEGTARPSDHASPPISPQFYITTTKREHSSTRLLEMSDLGIAVAKMVD